MNLVDRGEEVAGVKLFFKKKAGSEPIHGWFSKRTNQGNDVLFQWLGQYSPLKLGARYHSPLLFGPGGGKFKDNGNLV